MEAGDAWVQNKEGQDLSIYRCRRTVKNSLVLEAAIHSSLAGQPNILQLLHLGTPYIAPRQMEAHG